MSSLDKMKPVPFELQANNISDLVNLLNKIKAEVGDLPMYLNYWEYSSGPIRMAAGRNNVSPVGPPKEYLSINIQLHHDGDLTNIY